MKKVTKKKTTKSLPARKVAVAPKRAHKEGYTHSAVLSNNALMGLAVFFALVGLFVVMLYQRQEMEFERYNKAHSQGSMPYLARPTSTPTPAGKMMRY